MNKEQLKEAVGELNFVNTVFEADGVSYIDTAVSVAQVYGLIDQLDESEKVVIPKIVADWIEHCKGNDLDLYEAFGHSDMSVEASDLVGDMDADILARAWLDGYEVEKEKLYYVINDTQQLMLANIGYAKPTLIGFEFVKQVGFLKKYQLTEKEIKEYDERYWTFAVEVTE